MSESNDWAGQRLGLPESGVGSMARMGRRIVAITIDWTLALLIAQAFFDASNAAALIAFGLEQWLLIATTGTSVGHRIAGIAVRRLDGKWIGFWKALVRTSLLLLIIPATIWDADNRGLHDKAIGAVLVRTR